MSDYEQLVSNTNALVQHMKERGLMRELQIGDEYFPDPEDELWNEAIEAAEAIARDEWKHDEIADAISALKLPPTIYQGQTVIAEREEYK